MWSVMDTNSPGPTCHHPARVGKYRRGGRGGTQQWQPPWNTTHLWARGAYCTGDKHGLGTQQFEGVHGHAQLLWVNTFIQVHTA